MGEEEARENCWSRGTETENSDNWDMLCALVAGIAETESQLEWAELDVDVLSVEGVFTEARMRRAGGIEIIEGTSAGAEEVR